MARVHPISNDFTIEMTEYIFINQKQMSDGIYVKIMDEMKHCYDTGVQPHTRFLAFIRHNKSEFREDVYESMHNKVLTYIIPREPPEHFSSREVQSIFDILVQVFVGVFLLVLQIIFLPSRAMKWCFRNIDPLRLTIMIMMMGLGIYFVVLLTTLYSSIAETPRVQNNATAT